MCKFVIFRAQFILSVLVVMSASVKVADGKTIVAPDQRVATDSILWQGNSLSLQEVKVVSSFKRTSSSALRLTTIDNSQIAVRATARTYTELLKSVPGVYATAESGSYGDAKVNIRGFKQENISVLLNGIPISGLTSGNMFWNNWMGLTDATYAVQVQKGVGGSMLSDNSVGGTINIITASTQERFSVQAGAHSTHYGTGKGFFNVNSGELGRGWSLSLMASYVGGKGYVDRTNVNSFAYMLNISKVIDRYNTLLFTAIGSPERHEQRSSRLSNYEVEKYGLKYNKNWGWRGVEAYNLSKNNYFKPYFTLQHLFSKGILSLTSSVYLSVGNGGGRWSESKGRMISDYRTSDGLIDWDAVEADNVLVSGEGEAGSARNILSEYRAGHTQAGAVVSAVLNFNKNWSLDAGAHYQHYSTWENEMITDLLGGEYWWEDYQTKSLAGLAGRNPVKRVGDFIRTDNGKVTDHFTVYAMGSWKNEFWDVRFGGSLFAASHRRWDKYNYAGNIWSDRASGNGYSLKVGLLSKPGRGHSVYLNGGVYSRMPYAETYFASGNNAVSNNVKNERNLIGELGYRFVYSRGGVEVNGYCAYWKNKTLMSDPYKQADALESMKYMVTGLDALHCGLEAEAWHRFANWVKFSAFASVGDWRWRNDVSAVIYDEYSGLPLDQINVYCNGIPVGDAPQTQVGAALEFRLPLGFGIDADWTFNDRMYADFDPAGRTNPDDRQPSYRIPSYHLLNASVSWSGNLGRRVCLTVFANGYNLLNTRYIERGKDGAGHDLDSFRGFWGFGRNFNFGFRFNFS